MARRKARIPQGKKIQPAVKDLIFDLNVGGIGVTTHDYVSLSQVASIVNRRFYRAGLNWAVAGFEFITPGPYTGEVSISKIPDTWVASNAWEKGFRTWQKMNNEALAESESARPKFLDFKVFMDSDHHANGVAANLLPLNASGVATAGAWEMSQMVIPTSAQPGATYEREFIWTGANYPGAGASGLDAVSLIEGYAASRALPDVLDPNLPDDMDDAEGNVPQNWIAATFNEGTDQTDDVLETMFDYQQSPYPYENDGTHTDTQYPGGANQLPGLQIYDVAKMSNTTVGAKATIPGTNFQGGLIKISNTPRQYSLPNGDTTNAFGSVQMIIRLVPGPHRGYMCQPMQDV